MTEMNDKPFNFNQALNSKTPFVLNHFEFTQNKKYGNKPFIQLNMLFDEQNSSLYLQETKEYVSKKMNDLMNDIMEAFNHFQHPKNLKIESQDRMIKRGNSIKANEGEEIKKFFLEEDHKNMYKNYMKAVRIKKKEIKQNNSHQSYMEKKED